MEEFTIDITPKLFSDSIELMDVYIDRMRLDEDFDTIPNMLNRFNEGIFADGGISKDQLRQLAIYSTDIIYRFAAEIEMRDKYTDVYFKKVVAKLMKSLHDKGIELFYILDNEMDEDRFELTVDLYELSGTAVVTPYDDKATLSIDEVEDRLKRLMANRRNIVYIEKDASVNYMDKVYRIASESKYIGIFRNHAPTNKYIKLI